MLPRSSHTNLIFVFLGQNRTRLKGWIGCNKDINFCFAAHCDLCFSQKIDNLKISRCFKIRTFFQFRRILIVYFKCRVAKNFFKKSDRIAQTNISKSRPLARHTDRLVCECKNKVKYKHLPSFFSVFSSSNGPFQVSNSVQSDRSETRYVIVFF